MTVRGRGREWLAGIALVAWVAGCGSGGADGTRDTAPETVSLMPGKVRGRAGWPAPYVGELGRAEPIRVLIPRLGVDARLTTLSGAEGGGLTAPPWEQPNVAGWFGGGPTPGEKGTAVLAGHLAAPAGPAVFERLGELVKGDAVGVVRGDGTVTVFEVEGRERAALPPGGVHQPAERRELRLAAYAEAFGRAKDVPGRNVVVRALFRAAYLVTDFHE